MNDNLHGSNNTASEAAKADLSFDINDLVLGLTINSGPRVAQGYNTTNFDLEDELSGLTKYEEVEMDEETKGRIEELKKITDGIDSKLVDITKAPLQKKYKIDYANELNKQQLAAVVTTSEPLLVIAGAGSGKTRVITYNVSYLLENGLEAGEILLLTFTKKAATEMLDRVQKLLGSKLSGNTLGGTFHGFANNILRKYAGLLQLPNNFTIIDTEDVTDIISLLKAELGLAGKKGGKQFPKSAKVQNIISKSRNLEISIEQAIKRYYSECTDHTASIELISRALTAYKQQSSLFDYDDLVVVLRDKLRDNEPFRKKLQSSIKYVLVDEYQDTNNIQREIVEHIAGNSGRITIVGDDAQSIYAFRGANFENILRFPQTFPNCKVVKIEENYRSEQGILGFTNEIIEHAKIGFKKKLFSTRYAGKKPLVKRFTDNMAEAEYVADKILALMENDLSFSDFSVLTRSGWNSNYIQAEFTKRNIPFRVVGGFRFSERRHIKDVVAFLKITLNPMDAVAWHRVLKLLEGVGEVRAKEVIAAIHSSAGKVNFQSFAGKPYYQGLLTFGELFQKIIGSELSPSLMVEKILTVYKPILKQVEDDFQSREVDLDMFSEIAAKYSDLEKFLSDFTLEPPSTKWNNGANPLDEKDSVTVSTIHSAKGLEWHTVFIPFALDGILPSLMSFGSLQEIEEERRLFYVAASRAKENLFITMPAFVSSYDAFFTKPCRFLQEISKDKYIIEK